MQYAGIDIGKQACHATILDPEGEIRAQLEFTNQPTGWTTLEHLLDPGDAVAMEASTYAYPLHNHLRRRGHPITVAHARGVKQITQSESKTDRKDSHHLAHLLRTGYLPKAYIPDPDLLRLRDLLRARMEASQEASRAKNRIHAILARNGVTAPYTSPALFKPKGLAWLRQNHWNDERDTLLRLQVLQLETAQTRQDALHVELAKTAVDHDDAQLLMTIPGIDFYLALLILAETGDIRRFPTVGQFQSYAGCAPRVRESAGVHRGGGAMQSRNPALKWAMGMATERIVRHDNPIHHYYQKQARRVAKKQRAKARARRKTAALVYAMLKRGEPCRFARAANVEQKLARMQRLGRQEAGPRPPPLP